MDGSRKKANSGSSWNGSCIIGTRRKHHQAFLHTKSKNGFHEVIFRVRVRLITIRVLAGTYYWGEYPKTTKRTPYIEVLSETYAWSIATEERPDKSPIWLKYSPEQVLATYRRADEIRLEVEAR